jgi:predicted transcriptional regulator
MDLLKEAIENSAIIPRVQKIVLKVICSSSYPISAKEIEDILGLSRPSVSFSLKMLLKRHFINRSKDNVYLYSPNKERMKEIRERFVSKLSDIK